MWAWKKENAADWSYQDRRRVDPSDRPLTEAVPEPLRIVYTPPPLCVFSPVIIYPPPPPSPSI